MDDGPPDRLSFRQIAKQLSESHHAWPFEKALHALFGAFWHGEFERDGRTVTLENWGAPHKPHSLATRTFVLRMLPIGTAWVPQAIRRAGAERAQMPGYPWADLVRLLPDDYDPQWRRDIIERVHIGRFGYESWGKLPMPSQWRVGADQPGSPKRPRGRPGEAKALIMDQYRRRVRARAADPNMQAEARFLHDWLTVNHPGIGKVPQPRSIAKELYAANKAGVGKPE